MKDHQLGYTLPLQPLGAKIERHQATPEDRRAIELCKFEQKRHEVEPAPMADIPPSQRNDGWQKVRAMYGINVYEMWICDRKEGFYFDKGDPVPSQLAWRVCHEQA